MLCPFLLRLIVLREIADLQELPQKGALYDLVKKLKKITSLDRFYLEHDFSKGHLSHILRGTRNPSTLTLHKLADMLGVELVDFFIFPEQDKRHQIMALLADCSEETLDAVLRHLLERTQGSKALVEAKRG